MTIAFFGLPLAALLLERDGHDVVMAALCRESAVGTRRLRRVLGPSRVRVKPNPVELVTELHGLAPHLVVSWFWTTRLPPEVLGVAPRGAINVHPSLLPRHRGPDPTHWAIACGDTITGVTVHRMTAEYDAGPILARRELAIDPSWNAWQLARALDRPSLSLLREVVARLARGEAIAQEDQDERLATAAPFPREEDCAIRWAWTTERVLRHVRALAPAPGATFVVGRHLVVITQAEAALGFEQSLKPGQATSFEGRAIVRTGDGAVALRAGEIDGHPADARALATLIARAACEP